MREGRGRRKGEGEGEGRGRRKGERGRREREEKGRGRKGERGGREREEEGRGRGKGEGGEREREGEGGGREREEEGRGRRCVVTTRGPTYPGWWTTSRSIRTASSLLMFSKLMSFTCKGGGNTTWDAHRASCLIPCLHYTSIMAPVCSKHRLLLL